MEAAELSHDISKSPTPYQFAIERRAVEFLYREGIIDEGEADIRLAAIDAPSWTPDERYEVEPYDFKSLYPKCVADHFAVIEARSPSHSISSVLGFMGRFDRFTEDLEPMMLDEAFGEGFSASYEAGLRQIENPDRRAGWLGRLSIKIFG